MTQQLGVQAGFRAYPIPGLIVLGTMGVLASSAHAQWEVIRLQPPGTYSSAINGVSNGQQVGFVQPGETSSVNHAGFWMESAASWVDLHPVESSNSSASASSGGLQYGHFQTSLGRWHACSWSGSAATRVDLNPVQATQSYLWNASDGHQVGKAVVGGRVHASLWSGTAASWVDLNPAGAIGSEANGVSNGWQVGSAGINGSHHAGMWSGTAASWVDLHPPGALSSTAWGTFHGQHVGEVSYPLGVLRAVLWQGPSLVWVDLTPAGSSWASAFAAYEGFQVGYASIQRGEDRASLWNGTSASWVDLHALLPEEFTGSYAQGVWTEGNTIYVVGIGYKAMTYSPEALLWKRAGPPACVADFNGDDAVDFFDYNAFVTCFEGGECPPGKTADFDGDGTVDFFDYDAFVLAFEAPC